MFKFKFNFNFSVDNSAAYLREASAAAHGIHSSLHAIHATSLQQQQHQQQQQQQQQQHPGGNGSQVSASVVEIGNKRPRIEMAHQGPAAVATPLTIDTRETVRVG